PSTTNTSVNNNVSGNNVSTNVNAGGYNSSTTITTTTSSINEQPDNVAINVNGMNINVNTSGLANGVVSTSTVPSTTSTTTYNGSTNTNYNQNNNQQVNTTTNTNTGGCAYPMNEDSFRELTNSIGKQSFEDAKLKIAKQAVSASCISAGQVKKLMGSFTYEESKLDFAKYAYVYTYDKPNYFKINDAFTYSSSVDDLNNYLNSHK
ncbi:MAG: DUF4476 domain-containing protein, partial [Bacteroidia bacterium]